MGLPVPDQAGNWDSMTSDGRLFKLQVHSGSQCTEVFFYNATRDTVFHLNYTFCGYSDMRPGNELVSMERGRGETKMSHQLQPGNSVFFAAGLLKGSSLALGQNLVSMHSSDVKRDVAAKRANQISSELQSVRQPQHTGSSAAAAKAIARACLTQRTPFIDTQFPPVPDSIGFAQSEDISWARFGSYLQSPLNRSCDIFPGGGPEANDIDPGHLGDSWLLSAFSIACEEPQLIRQIFVSTQEELALRSAGAYVLRLCVHGWWQEVVVDDYIPCYAREPVFARCVEDPTSMWVSLMQKAYAKTKRSYARIMSGDALEAIMDITGCPSMRVNLTASPQAFADIEGALDADSLAFFHTCTTEKERYEKIGLIAGYCYAVLDAVTVKVQGGVIRLCKIRNPWGDTTMYNGKWCDSDPAWSKYPEARAACRRTTAGADGEFWMDFETVQQYFDTGAVLFCTTPRWVEVRIASEFKRGTPLHILEIWPNTSGECFFGLHVRSARQADFLATMLSIVSPEGEHGWTVHANAQSHGGRFCRARDITLRVAFTGPHASRRPHYLIWRTKDAADRQAVLSVHASSKFATLVVKRPSSSALEPLRFNPVWTKGNPRASFSASKCEKTPVSFQINRLATHTAASLNMAKIPEAAVSPRASRW